MEKTYFIHINKNIEPIDKITEQDMKKFKNGLLIKRFNKQLEENKKSTFDLLTLQNNFILINNYLLRAGLFSNPISYLNVIDFINTHIFPGNNIEVSLYIDQTIIYYDNECQKYIINTEDVKQILTHRPLILDINLMSLFQVQEPDLQKLKL